MQSEWQNGDTQTGGSHREVKTFSKFNQEALLPTAGVQKSDACLMILLTGSVD